jgi:hypothetical protein
LSLHPTITLCIDIYYVLGLTFTLSVSRDIRFLSSRFIHDRTNPLIRDCIASDLAIYRTRGFQPTAIHADGEFNAVRTLFPDIQFTICAADDHVPEVERAIRSVKESIRATIHGMPFNRLPRVLVKELTTFAVRTINMLPHPDGISPFLSPATIVTGIHKPDYSTLRLEFGTYVQVYDGTSNDTKSRTLGAIATNPTGNANGDYFFMSLATGQRIHRRSWTVLPISDAVISRVEAIALSENMPPVDDGHPLLEYDPDMLVDPDEYDRAYVPPVVAAPDSDHNLTSDAYTDESDDSSTASDDIGHHPDFDDDVPVPAVNHPPPVLVPPEERPITANDTDNTTTNITEPTDTTDTTEILENEERNTPETEEQIESENVENEERNTLENEERITPTPQPVEVETVLVPENEERNQPNTPTRKPGLRPKQKPNYSYRYSFAQFQQSVSNAHSIFDSVPKLQQKQGQFTPSQMQSIRKAIVGIMFTQMSAHKGIKKHGKHALDALRKEFLQFKALDVLEPLDAFTLTDEQKAESLRALSVIKEKRDGTIKGRTCADGSTQQGKFSKTETGSPTLANDALFMTIMIDAYENRDVATADIAGAYLHALMKHFITMRFVGWAVDLLCEVNPEYTKYVVYEGKTKVLYTRCNKAIYGCVVSGVLWYELFSSTLEQLGFTINPYDFCVANATIEGSQCTIGWFVDDTKISHANPDVVTNIINQLESKFGKMKVTRGNTHKFLGMDIVYLGDGTATIHMPSYITEAIDESGLDITSSATSPCAGTLYDVDINSPLLPPDKAKTFHSVVAKLIYVGTRARTDILLALSFLCGRVASPTKEDEQKLKRLLRYLYGTIDLTLRLGADSLNQFATWVDASFAVHPDMRSHTGGVISFGRGGIICKSKKQNINTKSSTEAELIGASDYLPNTLYVKLFMEAQGYPIDRATFHQDNESAIKMEQNGKASCGQRSRHIDIRYFFMTDHSRRRHINITHCRTENMLADFFTKPLQGALFRKFRSVLLGEAHTNTLNYDPTMSTSEERVDGKKDPCVVMTSQNKSVTLQITDGGETIESSDVITAANVIVANTSHSIEKYPEDNNI